MSADDRAAPVPIRALDGVRVVELSIGIAGPSCGRILAFHGADVIRIESRRNPETLRLIGSGWARAGEAAEAYADTNPLIAEFSSGKRSVGLDLKHPSGREAARRLIAASDVFLTNLAATALEHLHLTYDEVRAACPDVVYVGLPGFGFDESLPYHRYVSWGPNQAPLVGLDVLTGEPDREPCGITSTAPPDYVAGLHAAMATLTALEHRDATGEGCLVDVAQFQTSAALLGPFIADHALTGRVQERTGNRDPRYAPCGVYPCRGRTAHVAISVAGDDAWAALCRVAERPGWRADGRFATESGRRAHADDLDRLVGEWTAGHTADEVATWLQAEGVAAYPVVDAPRLLGDPQLLDRSWYLVRRSRRFERDLFGGHPLHLSDTPGCVQAAGPSLGEHTAEVLEEVAGYAPGEIAELVRSGAADVAAAPGLVLRRPYDPYLDALGLGSPPSAGDGG